MKKFKGEFILLLASLLWGSCFVFQKMGMDYVGPYTLGACRFFIGAIILIPFMPIFTKMRNKELGQGETRITREHGGFGDKKLYLGGIFCGISLFAAASLQQIGLIYTTAGKAGFITSLEIVLVAGVSILVTRKLQLHILVGVFIAVAGMYLLCMTEGFYLGKGDAFELAGIIFWAAQVLLIDHYAKIVDVIKLSFIQFTTTGLLSLLFMVLFEHPHWSQIQSGWLPILYTGIIEVALAYTLQMVGQMYVSSPVIAAVILSLESVFAAICGVIFLGEVMSGREVMGCVAMLGAILITQIPEEHGISLSKRKKEYHVQEEKL